MISKESERMNPTGISLDDKTRELLNLMATREQRSRSAIVRRAIWLYAKQESGE